jgi:hypothetical protein
VLKNVALSISTDARAEMEKENPTSAVADAFRFIGSLNMLLGGIAVPPSNREQINGLFQPNHEYYDWMQKRLREAARMSIFVTTERINWIRVEVRWYRKNESVHCAELISLINESGPVSVSRTDTSDRKAA